MIKITSTIFLQDNEITLSFIRSPGPGGQKVNKTATAVQLRFNVEQSPTLPPPLKERLKKFAGRKLTQHGELIIKASRYRTKEHNRQDALMRLKELIKRAAVIPKKRKKTKPTAASIERRLTQKKRHAKTKSMRRGQFD